MYSVLVFIESGKTVHLYRFVIFTNLILYISLVTLLLKSEISSLRWFLSLMVSSGHMRFAGKYDNQKLKQLRQ